MHHSHQHTSVHRAALLLCMFYTCTVSVSGFGLTENRHSGYPASVAHNAHSSPLQSTLQATKSARTIFHPFSTRNQSRRGSPLYALFGKSGADNLKTGTKTADTSSIDASGPARPAKPLVRAYSLGYMRICVGWTIYMTVARLTDHIML
jgi:hypothetical protein